MIASLLTAQKENTILEKGTNDSLAEQILSTPAESLLGQNERLLGQVDSNCGQD